MTRETLKEIIEKVAKKEKEMLKRHSKVIDTEQSRTISGITQVALLYGILEVLIDIRDKIKEEK